MKLLLTSGDDLLLTTGDSLLLAGAPTAPPASTTLHPNDGPHEAWSGTSTSEFGPGEPSDSAYSESALDDVSTDSGSVVVGAPGVAASGHRFRYQLPQEHGPDTLEKLTAFARHTGDGDGYNLVLYIFNFETEQWVEVAKDEGLAGEQQREHEGSIEAGFADFIEEVDGEKYVEVLSAANDTSGTSSMLSNTMHRTWLELVVPEPKPKRRPFRRMGGYAMGFRGMSR